MQSKVNSTVDNARGATIVYLVDYSYSTLFVNAYKTLNMRCL